MNDLEKLIQNICPNGVERIRIGAFAKVQKTKNKGHISEEAYSITQRGLIPTNEFFGEKTKITSSDTSGYYLVYKNWFVYSPSRIDVGSINYLKVNGPVIVSPLDVVFSVDEEKILPVYLLTYLLSHYGMRQILDHRQGIEGTGRRTLPFAELAKVEVPLPPLPIQQRIVEILDKFTSLVSSLDSEIALRQKQYEYYRNKLLSFEGENIEYKKLGDVCDTLSGFPFDSSKFTNEGIRLMRGMNIKRGYLDFSEDLNRYWPTSQNLEKYLLEDNDIVMSMDGSLVGKSFATIEKKHLPLILVQRVARIRSTKIDTHYVYQCIKYNFSDYVDKKKTGGAIPHISMKDIDNFIIPFPPLDRQLSIVRTLDTFESLLTNLKKERELRQKQYEYYREKLLTFA